MHDIPIELERVLLETVAHSRGEWSVRDIDFAANRRIAPGELTVLDELKSLESRGLVERVQRAHDASFVAWNMTPRGRARLAPMT